MTGLFPFFRDRVGSVRVGSREGGRAEGVR